MCASILVLVPSPSRSLPGARNIAYKSTYKTSYVNRMWTAVFGRRCKSLEIPCPCFISFYQGCPPYVSMCKQWFPLCPCSFDHKAHINHESTWHCVHAMLCASSWYKDQRRLGSELSREFLYPKIVHHHQKPRTGTKYRAGYYHA